MVVCSLADVLSSENHSTGLALKAADMPLLLQCQKRLALLDLFFTTRTVFREREKEEERVRERENASHVLLTFV